MDTRDLSHYMQVRSLYAARKDGQLRKNISRDAHNAGHRYNYLTYANEYVRERKDIVKLYSLVSTNETLILPDVNFAIFTHTRTYTCTHTHKHTLTRLSPR